MALKIIRTIEACNEGRPEQAVFWTHKAATFRRFIEEMLDICSDETDSTALLLLDEGISFSLTRSLTPRRNYDR